MTWTTRLPRLSGCQFGRDLEDAVLAPPQQDQFRRLQGQELAAEFPADGCRPRR